MGERESFCRIERVLLCREGESQSADVSHSARVLLLIARVILKNGFHSEMPEQTACWNPNAGQKAPFFAGLSDPDLV